MGGDYVKSVGILSPGKLCSPAEISPVEVKDEGQQAACEVRICWFKILHKKALHCTAFAKFIVMVAGGRHFIGLIIKFNRIMLNNHFLA